MDRVAVNMIVLNLYLRYFSSELLFLQVHINISNKDPLKEA